MARVTAIRLRDAARAAMLSAGGRGFMRFLPAGGALLATDALRHCGEAADGARVKAALHEAGFECREKDGLLEISPTGELLAEIAWSGPVDVDWTSPLHPVQAMARSLTARERMPLSEAGRQLVLETLRITWQPAGQAPAGLSGLWARVAVMLRTGEHSGLHEAGALLAEYARACGGDAKKQTGRNRNEA